MLSVTAVPECGAELDWHGRPPRASLLEVRSLTLLERLLVRTCRWHDWGRPITVPGIRYEAPGGSRGYDSHQTCWSCGVARLYNGHTLAAGPMVHLPVQR